MPYAELHAKTNFSFLEGASHPDELVGRAAELGYAALAVTDRNSLAGVVRAHQAAKEAGLKLLVGAEITPEDAPPVVLWATDRAAYGRLARLITRGCRRAEKGQCRLTLDDVAQHAAGLLAGVKTEFGSRKSEVGNGGHPLIFRIPPSEFRLPRGVWRPLLPAGRVASRAGRPAEAGPAAGTLPAKRCAAWWPPATCIITSPERQALCDVLTAIRCGSHGGRPPARGSLPMPSGTCNRRRTWPRCSPRAGSDPADAGDCRALHVFAG